MRLFVFFYKQAVTCRFLFAFRVNAMLNLSHQCFKEKLQEKLPDLVVCYVRALSDWGLTLFCDRYHRATAVTNRFFSFSFQILIAGRL